MALQLDNFMANHSSFIETPIKNLHRTNPRLSPHPRHQLWFNVLLRDLQQAQYAVVRLRSKSSKEITLDDWMWKINILFVNYL